MNKRVIEIIERKKLTPSRFADKIGVPRSTISHIISGRNRPSIELVTKISDSFPEVNLDWLIKGKGPMNKAQTSLFDNDISTGKKDEIPENASKTSLSDDSLHLSTKENIEKLSTTKKSSNQTFDKQISDEALQKVRADVSTIILVYPDESFKVLKPRK